MKIVGQEKIALVFGVAAKTIVEWQESGFPIAQQGQRGIASEYESSDCIAWYVKREMNRAGNETARDRLARLQGDEAELRLDEKRGALIDVAKIEPAWVALIAAARGHLRTEPDRLAHLLETTEGVDAKRDLIAESFDEFLLKLSTYDIEADDEPSGEGGTAVAAT